MALGHLGITAIVVEAQAPEGELYCLKIDEKGNAHLISAQEYKGMRTYKLVERVLETYGK